MASGSRACAEAITSRLAQRTPGTVVLVEADGRSWTAADCLRAAYGHATTLAGAGIGAGDRAAVLQSLSADALFTWWGLDLLGAVYLPLNPKWTDRMAGRVLADRAPTLLLADGEHESVARRVGAPLGVPVALTGGTPASERWPPARDEGHLLVPAPTGPLDDCCIVHNSGRPGIHHGVRVSWRMFAVMAANMASLHPEARVLVSSAPCFFGTLVSIYGAVAGAGSVAIAPGLDAGTFWPTVRRTGTTFASLLDPTLPDLMSAPPTPHDLDHPLRMVTADPEQHELNVAAATRFGLHWISGLAKTEVCGAVATGVDPGPDDGVGDILPPFEGRVVDPAGRELGAGEAGELLLRSAVPGGLPAGYVDDPEATAELWVDGWVRTGWRLRSDGAGRLHRAGDLSVDRVIVKREGYLFAADLEAEIVAVTAARSARVSARPDDADPAADPVVVAWVTGDDLDGPTLWADLRAGLPAHLVPDRVVATAALPDRPDDHPVPVGAWSVGQ